MKKKLKSLKASCLCKNIKMLIKGEFRPIINCHCIQCIKTHGNYASYTSILEKNIVFKSRKTLRWYKSSSGAKRGFCHSCGASIFFKRFKSKSISLSAGLIENPTGLKTISNIFTHNKSDYYKISNKLPKFKKYS